MCGRRMCASVRFTPTCVGKSLAWNELRLLTAVHPHVCGEIKGLILEAQVVVRFTATCVGKSAAQTAQIAEVAVHPHVCGEISSCAKPAGAVNGSPPRVWGDPPATWVCAGDAVHPHVCGEIVAKRRYATGPGGSPPRVWGNLERLRHQQPPVRFTPTCVGKSARGRAHLQRLQYGSPPRVWGNLLSLKYRLLVSAVHPHVCGEIRIVKSIPRADRPVHPHVCGENCERLVELRTLNGSPPRVWGNQLVGRTRTRPTSVHPHVCGEIAVSPAPDDGHCGSPPRVWGNRCLPARQEFHVRFTPTCVGKSDVSLTQYHALTVHPHVCGEIHIVINDVVFCNGSPPRVWGNRDSLNGRAPCCRFTPTCVGKSVSTLAAGDGELRFTPTCVGKSTEATHTRDRDGSPPRVWGNLAAGDSGGLGFRFTPTCVGKSRRQVQQ